MSEGQQVRIDTDRTDTHVDTVQRQMVIALMQIVENIGRIAAWLEGKQVLRNAGMPEPQRHFEFTGPAILGRIAGALEDLVRSVDCK